MNAARLESQRGQQWSLSFRLHVDSARLLGSRLVVPIVRENGILSVTSARRSDGRIWRFGVHAEQLETDNNSSSAVWKSLGPSPVRRKKGKHVKGKRRSARRIRRKRAKDAAPTNTRTQGCGFVVQQKNRGVDALTLTI